MRVYRNIAAASKIYIIAILIFSAFRCVLLFTEFERISGSTPLPDIATAFFIGLRFDSVIACYILTIPFVLTSLSAYFKSAKILGIFCLHYLIIAFSAAFFICASDIPYFNQFFSHVSVSAFAWNSSPAFVLKMIAAERRYWLYLLPAAASVYLFYKASKRIFNVYAGEFEKLNKWKFSVLSVLFLVALFAGMRGRVAEKAPIKVWHGILLQ